MRPAILLLLILIIGCKKDDDPAPLPKASFSFTFSDSYGFAPARVYFASSSLNAVSLVWDFGDGGKSVATKPEHIFMKGGTFQVKLTAINSEGKSVSFSQVVIVKNQPTKVRIDNFTVIGLPLLDNQWDQGSGPDVFFVIRDDKDTSVKTSNKVFSDVTLSSLPLRFDPSDFPVILENNKTYTVELWDVDAGANQFMGGYFLKPVDRIPQDGNGYLTKFVMQNPSSEFIFDLGITWIP